MPYDAQLAARLKTAIPDRSDVEETRLFGGFGYLLAGNMCCGAHRDCFRFRLGVERFERLSRETPALRPMDLTGRVMKGWCMIEGRPCAEGELDALARAALAFAAELPPKTGKQ